ncbi:radical SAM protein [Candidatus Woesearchaeota archaeon]|nr:radical SAM protein [Candidatus Woesearchaeota archaeon]
MAELAFKDLSFEEKDSSIRVNFLKIFYFDVDKLMLKNIGKFRISKNKIEFFDVDDKRAQRSFGMLLSKGFADLKSRLSNKPAVYIHKNSGIPLIGSSYFGLIDRGTNLIEIRPLTGCNLNCIFCSVDEGLSSRKKADFVVEKDYLIEEFKKIVVFKQENCIEAHINAQGEPLLYADIVELVAEIAKIPEVKSVSMDTNGTLLDKQLTDKLAKAGLTRINLSLHALDQKTASKIAGTSYNLRKLMEIASYIPKKMDLIIAPVWLPGYNDKELVKLAKFAYDVGAGKKCPAIGIQNFLNYQFGRNPIKGVPMEVFYKKLHDLEQEHKLKLICDKSDFRIKKSMELPKPFKKGDVIKAKLACRGRFSNEMLAAASNRVISVPNCYKKEGSVKLKIRRTKHNIFLGELL